MIGERPDPKGGWASPRTLVEAAIAGRVELPDVDDLPVLMCKGLCHEQCTIVPMTPVELLRVERAIGRPLEVQEDGRCGALNDCNRCDGYNVRPLICRIWGMAEGAMCGHGCVTTSGRYLEYHEVAGLMARAALEEGEHVVPPMIGEGKR